MFIVCAEYCGNGFLIPFVVATVPWFLYFCERENLQAWKHSTPASVL